MTGGIQRGMWPLAVGLMHLPVGTSGADRARARVQLGIRAAEHGYALIETYETGYSALSEETAFQSVQALARRTKAAAVVYAGEVDVARLEQGHCVVVNALVSMAIACSG